MAIQGSRPPNDRTIAPNLIIRDVEAAIDFYERALGAEVLYRGTMPNGVTLHAQLRIGQGYFLLSNEIMRNERMPTGSPETLGGVTAVFEVFVDDVDSAFDRAVNAGGSALGEITDTFYGDRIGMFRDPFGHVWNLSTPREVLSSDELYQRMLEHFSQLTGARS